jgi:hypothetical protein
MFAEVDRRPAQRGGAVDRSSFACFFFFSFLMLRKQ